MSKRNPLNQIYRKQNAMLYEDIPKIKPNSFFSESEFLLYTKAAKVCPTEPNAIR